MFYSWPCLSRLGGGRSKRCGGLWGRQAGIGHSVASVGWPGQAGHGARAVVTDWQPADQHTGHLRGLCCRRPATQCLLCCLSLSSLAARLHRQQQPFTILALAWPRPFSCCGLWGCGQDPKTWSPGAGFASVSVTDSLGPWTLGLSFPMCHITRLTVWQMFWQ